MATFNDVLRARLGIGPQATSADVLNPATGSNALPGSPCGSCAAALKANSVETCPMDDPSHELCLSMYHEPDCPVLDDPPRVSGTLKTPIHTLTFGDWGDPSLQEDNQ